MKFLLQLLPLSLLAIGAAAYNPKDEYAVVIDCKTCPESCNNDCYAIYAAGKSNQFTYGGKGSGGNNRKLSGCTKNPCNNKKLKYGKSGNSCDEYPYASATQGGKDATLRCVPLADNKDEGNQLNKVYRKACEYNKGCKLILYTKNYGSKTPFCTGKAGTKPKNDGYEFKLKNGNFVSARMAPRDVDYEDVIPDESLFFPAHLRREFLLEDGSRILSMDTSNDTTTDHVGRLIYSAEGEPTAIARELFGEEKSEGLRPSDM